MYLHTHTHIYIYLSLYVIITIIARIIQIGPTARRCRSPMSPRPFATQPLWGARRGLEHWDSMTHKHGEHRSLTMFNQQTGRYSPTCFWRMDSWSTFFFCVVDFCWFMDDSMLGYIATVSSFRDGVLLSCVSPVQWYDPLIMPALRFLWSWLISHSRQWFMLIIMFFLWECRHPHFSFPLGITISCVFLK